MTTSNADRKLSAEWARGKTDGYRGAAPDYSQAETQELLDYRDGYRIGQAMRLKEKVQVNVQTS